MGNIIFLLHYTAVFKITQNDAVRDTAVLPLDAPRQRNPLSAKGKKHYSILNI